jgi:DNA-binding NarL/FixJ family response regulator
MLRILIVEDHATVRGAIRSLLELHPEWRVVGEATDGLEAVEQTGRLNPDLVLLDLEIPKLSGLEAMREILKGDSPPQILILTAYQSEVLSREVIRRGAQAIVAKSAAHALLIPAIESLIQRREGIHLAGSILRKKHVAVLSHSKAEAFAILDPFIAEGIRQGERVFCFIDPDDRDLEIDRGDAQHQVDYIPWQDAMLRGGHFDQREMLELIREEFSDAPARGFSRSRLIGRMEWALEDVPGVHDLVEFEARVNSLLQNFDDVAVCAYEVSKFDAGVIVDVIRTHPAVVIGGLLYDSPFYVPPDQMIEELRQR